jgi:hypothetical protein
VRRRGEERSWEVLETRGGRGEDGEESERTQPCLRVRGNEVEGNGKRNKANGDWTRTNVQLLILTTHLISVLTLSTIRRPYTVMPTTRSASRDDPTPVPSSSSATTFPPSPVKRALPSTSTSNASTSSPPTKKPRRKPARQTVEPHESEQVSSLPSSSRLPLADADVFYLPSFVEDEREAKEWYDELLGLSCAPLPSFLPRENRSLGFFFSFSLPRLLFPRQRRQGIVPRSRSTANR